MQKRLAMYIQLFQLLSLGHAPRFLPDPKAKTNKLFRIQFASKGAAPSPEGDAVRPRTRALICWLNLVPGGQNIYVAVIDDDESARLSLTRMLRAADLLPVPYPSAESFLMDRKRPQFDCLVLDIEMRGMSGLKLLTELTAVGDDTPVFLVTGHDSIEMRAQARACNCAGFFRKTDSNEAVLNAILDVVRQSSTE